MMEEPLLGTPDTNRGRSSSGESPITISISSIDEKAVDMSMLEQLARHVINYKHDLRTTYIILINGGIFIFGGAATWLYVRPSNDYGWRKGGLSEVILQIIGNTVGAFLTLANVGIIVFYDILIKKIIADKKLSALLE